jgi:hypothetical protein
MCPEEVLGTNRSFRIIHAFFVRTPDDAACRENRFCSVVVYELQDFAADNGIGPHVLIIGEPTIQRHRLGILFIMMPIATLVASLSSGP